MSQALDINLAGFGVLGPEIILLVTMVAIVLVSMFTEDRTARKFSSIASIIGTLGAFVALFQLASKGIADTFFFDLLVIDPFSVYVKILVLLGTFITILLAWNNTEIPDIKSAEFHILLLTTFLGMSLVSSAYHLLIAYIGLELISLPSYVMTAINHNDRRSSEAGVKYLIYGSVSAGVFLFGISLLYGFSGKFTLDGIAGAISGTDQILGYGIALGMVLVGIGFKCSFFPMQMWVPDVYQGAPKSVGGFLSTAPKTAGFALLIRFAYEFGPVLLEHPGFERGLTVFFVFVSAVTMTIGNTSALVQDNLKRLLGYSTIAHVGYIMMGFALVGTASREAGFQAMMYYLFIYTLMNLGAFGVLIALDCEWMDELDGLARFHPVVAISMAGFMFSLTGLPPLAGFPGKFYLFFEIIGEGGWALWILALVGGLNAVISLFYYARVLKHLFLNQPEEQTEHSISPILPSGTVAILAGLVLGLGLYWSPLWNFTERFIVLL